MSKISEQELQDRLDQAKKLIHVGGTYEHYKKKHYRAIDLVINEADNEVYVVYEMMYGKRLKFIRPVSNWIEDVEVEGTRLPRFSLQTDS